MLYLINKPGITTTSIINIRVDNEGAEVLGQNSAQHSRTKHFHTRYHFLRECVKDRSVNLSHVQPADMRSDMLTKVLGRILLEKRQLMLNIVFFFLTCMVVCSKEGVIQYV